MKDITQQLQGVFVPMITPMDDREDLDEEGVRRFTQWLVDQGVNGIYPASGCGEVWKLSVAEKQSLMDIVIEQAKGKLLVLCGTGAGSTRETIDLTQYAQEKGADAVVIWPPYHMGRAYTEDAIHDHYLTVANAVDIPIVVYDSPEITGYPLSVDLTKRLAEIENVVGLKDSTGDVNKFARTIQAVGDRIAVLQGWDSLLLSSLPLGAPGAVLSAANVCPGLIIDLIQDFQNGDIQAARQRHQQLITFISSGPWQTDQFQAMKEVLNMLGLPGGRIRKPWFSTPFTPAQKEELAGSLRVLGLIE